MTRAVAVLVMIGCGSLGPNKAPELLSFNGQETHDKKVDFGLVDVPVITPGEDFDIELEVRDRQGDAVFVWFAAPPPGLDFDAESTSGVWRVPLSPVLYDESLDIVLEDDNPDPRSVTYPIPLEWDLEEEEG